MRRAPRRVSHLDCDSWRGLWTPVPVCSARLRPQRPQEARGGTPARAGLGLRGASRRIERRWARAPTLRRDIVIHTGGVESDGLGDSFQCVYRHGPHAATEDRAPDGL